MCQKLKQILCLVYIRDDVASETAKRRCSFCLSVWFQAASESITVQLIVMSS